MKCDWCDRTDGIAGVNDRNACPDHVDIAITGAVNPVRAFMRAADAVLQARPHAARESATFLQHAAECLRASAGLARDHLHDEPFAQSCDAVALQAEDLLRLLPVERTA